MVIDIPKRKEIYNNTVLLQVLLQVLIFGPNHWLDKTQGKSLYFFYSGVRSNADLVFIFQLHSVAERKHIWETYFGKMV